MPDGLQIIWRMKTKNLLYLGILVLAAIGIQLSQKYVSPYNSVLGILSELLFGVVAALYFFRLLGVFKK